MSADQARQAKALHEYELLAKNNVVGVGVGYKESHGVVTDDVAVVVLVEQKKPLAALQPEDMIPRELQGMKTDVIEVGFLRANQTARDRFRPIIPSGVSIGHYKVTAGTLGTIVKDRLSQELFLLSNNHVLANSNDALIDDPILQPAAMDGGQSPGDVVARLERYVKLMFIDDPAGVPELIGAPPPVVSPPPTTGQPPPTPPAPPGAPKPPTAGTGGTGCDVVAVLTALINALATLLGSNQRVVATSAQALSASAASASLTDRIAAQASIPENRADCAIGRPIDPGIFSDDIRQIGIVNQVRPVQLGMRVRKYGRTTEYTEGTVNLLNATVNIAYSTQRGQRTARFVNQVIAQGMSQGGDSGSLVVDASTNMAVGLLFAGSPQATIFTPIQTVLDALGIDL